MFAANLNVEKVVKKIVCTHLKPRQHRLSADIVESKNELRASNAYGKGSLIGILYQKWNCFGDIYTDG